MRPATPIPDDLRDRLDAAREFLDFEIEWVEKGDPRCYGRQFGFWVVTAAPYGWREQLAAWRASRPVCGIEPPPAPCPMWVRMEWPDLAHTLRRVMDEAERKWPAAA